MNLIKKNTVVLHPKTGAQGVVTAINNKTITITSSGEELILTHSTVNALLQSGELLPKSLV